MLLLFPHQTPTKLVYEDSKQTPSSLLPLIHEEQTDGQDFQATSFFQAKTNCNFVQTQLKSYSQLVQATGWSKLGKHLVDEARMEPATVCLQTQLEHL